VREGSSPVCAIGKVVEIAQYHVDKPMK